MRSATLSRLKLRIMQALCRMIDELVAWFGGKPLPIMTQLMESEDLRNKKFEKLARPLRSKTLKEKGK